MTATAESGLVAAVARFCRALRERGLLVSPGETVDAARVLTVVDLADRHDVYLALRAVLTTRPEDYAAFDELFATIWRERRAAPADTLLSPVTPPTLPAPRPPADGVRHITAATLERWTCATGGEHGEPVSIPRPSEREVLGERDFRTFGDDELHAITRVAVRMARRLASRPSRRWKVAARGTRVHLRRTLRRALGTGGAPAELVFRERKPRRTKLAVLCDVSGSMDFYSRFLLQFLYALQNSFARVETFVFATRLSRITQPLGAPRYRRALVALADEVRDWSGGTRIGESLAAFDREWGRLVDRRTIVIILSDGWDTGDPAQLGDALARIRRRAGRVIWLNPLLGSPGYQPLTRGMQAALPHVDVFHPVHNLASLEALVRHLAL